jgi:hypothetical protein
LHNVIVDGHFEITISLKMHSLFELEKLTVIEVLVWGRAKAEVTFSIEALSFVAAFWSFRN